MDDDRSAMAADAAAIAHEHKTRLPPPRGSGGVHSIPRDTARGIGRHAHEIGMLNRMPHALVHMVATNAGFVNRGMPYRSHPMPGPAAWCSARVACTFRRPEPWMAVQPRWTAVRHANSAAGKSGWLRLPRLLRQHPCLMLDQNDVGHARIRCWPMSFVLRSRCTSRSRMR